jgi:putative sigma-54 modulation protein
VQVSISARHGDLNSDTQELVEQKARKLLKFFDRITSITVTVDLKADGSPDVEIKVSAEETEDFVAQDTGNNILTATESVVQKLEQQLRKHKEKLTSHRHAANRHNESDARVEE